MNSENSLKTRLLATKWNFPISWLNKISEYEKSFIEEEFLGIRKLKNYEERVSFHGFTNMDKVLDAGCGMGQWTVAFAKYNRSVIGIDKNSTRLQIAEDLCKNNELNNVEFSPCSLEELPFESGSFDGIFCYSVIMFTNIPATLKEFNRVLKPNGKLYIMTDVWGWYMYSALKSWKNILGFGYMLLRTITRKKSNIIFSEKWFLNQLTNAGFQLIEVGKEASTSLNSEFKQNRSVQKFYESNKGNLKTLIEVCAKK